MLIEIAPRTSFDEGDLSLAPWLSPIIDAAKTGSSIIEPLQALVRSLGFDTFVYAVGVDEHLHDGRFYFWTTVPTEWVAEYDRNSYVEIDPRVAYGWTTWPTPLIWDESLASDDERAKAFLDRAACHGIGSGLAVYLREGDNKIMFALNRRERKLDDVARVAIVDVMPMAMYLGTVINRVFITNVIAQGIPPSHQGRPLSGREIQCLSMAARGLTSIDIGQKLAITERTVNFHFSNIISKLGVLNRKEAIAMGIAHGLIRVDPKAAPLVPQPPSKFREAQLKRWENLRNERR
jgi:DNA-binding CsgD family transcriptional regulator